MYHNTNLARRIVLKNLRVYKLSIFIPDSIEVKIEKNYIFIKGVLGELTHKLHNSIDAQLNDLKYLEISSKFHNTRGKALIGTTRSLIKGMIVGVTSGFIKKLQLVGIGYRSSIKDNLLTLMVGLSHPVDYRLPSGISAQCLNQTEIILTSIDKQLIGQVAADLRAIRPPEPFKGKGIRYKDEVIRQKDTKKR